MKMLKKMCNSPCRPLTHTPMKVAVGVITFVLEAFQANLKTQGFVYPYNKQFPFYYHSRSDKHMFPQPCPN